MKKTNEERINSNNVFFTTSWDDGNLSDLRIADLLQKYNLPGTFYIPLFSPKKSLDSKQICEISSNFDIGAHTMTHSRMTDCTDKQAKNEIIESKKYVEDITSKECNSFCFPEGKFLPKHLRMVASAGFLGCRSVELLNNKFPQYKFGIYLLPTTFQVYPHTRLDYLKNICKRNSLLNLTNYFKIRSLNWLDSAKLLFIDTLTEGGIFHIWGHSWEIDEMHLWNNLENFFYFVSSCNSNFHSLDNSGLYGYLDR